MGCQMNQADSERMEGREIISCMLDQDFWGGVSNGSRAIFRALNSMQVFWGFLDGVAGRDEGVWSLIPLPPSGLKTTVPTRYWARPRNHPSLRRLTGKASRSVDLETPT